MTRSMLFVVLLTCPALAQDEAPRHDLRERYVPQVGQRVKMVEAERMENRYAVMQRGVAVERQAESGGAEQVYVQEVLRVDEDEAADYTLTYERFKDLETDEEHPVEGLVVTFTDSEGTIAYSVAEGVELPAALKTVLDEDAGESEAEEDGSEDETQALLPEQPMAVGERWEISLEEMAEHFELELMDLVTEKCSAHGQLVAIEREGDVDYRLIELEMNVVTKRFQGMSCPEPVVFAMTAKMRMSPQSPFGSVELSATIKGQAVPPDFPPGACLELDSSIERREVRSAPE